MKRLPPQGLLIDFTGVVQGFARPYEVEPKYGLEPGAFHRAGMEWKNYIRAVTGEWTRAQWLSAIVEATGAPPEAVAEWDSYRGYVDEAVLGFVREVRASGKPVGLATNATSDLRDDLTRLGLEGEFDAVICSSEVGWHKPSREFFTAAVEAIGVPAREVLFVDDTDRNVQGARAFGLSALRWTGPDDLGYLRSALLG